MDMWKKGIGVILACIMLIGVISLPVSAEAVLLDDVAMITPLATNSFSMTVPANSLIAANTSFSLMPGETVTINASYAPSSADMDFGLLDADGMFRYYNVTNGSINQKITIEVKGKYTLVVRNNSDMDVDVMGFVNY